MLRETNLRVAPHLTCVGASRDEVLGIAQDYWRLGACGTWSRCAAMRPRTVSLAGAIGRSRRGSPMPRTWWRDWRQVGHFEVSVAAYPEGHPESGGVDADLQNLKRKIDAGANRAITQFFFETDVYLRYRDRCAAAGIRASIVPGILPDHTLPADAALRRTLRRLGAGLAPRPLRWAR